jgi:hypothetical protein
VFVAGKLDVSDSSLVAASTLGLGVVAGGTVAVRDFSFFSFFFLLPSSCYFLFYLYILFFIYCCV